MFNRVNAIVPSTDLLVSADDLPKLFGAIVVLLDAIITSSEPPVRHIYGPAKHSTLTLVPHEILSLLRLLLLLFFVLAVNCHLCLSRQGLDKSHELLFIMHTLRLKWK